jgi:hypothetical protein
MLYYNHKKKRKGNKKMKDYRTCETCIGPTCPYNQHCGEVMEIEKANRLLLIQFNVGMIEKEEVLAKWKEV